jgi:DNA-binding CsgD family transcriptional regulator/PAS domain-containing protein
MRDKGKINRPSSRNQGTLMTDSPDLSQLLAAMYDCAIAPDLWPHVLPLLAGYMDSRTAAIGARSRAAGTTHFFVEFGFESEVHEVYVSDYRAINPRISAMRMFGVDEPVRTEDVLDIEEFKQSKYYREFHLPYNVGDVLASKVIEDPHRIVSCNVSGKNGYSLADVERFRALCPHLRRVLTISDLLEQKTVERNSLAEVLDRLAVAVILVDPKQRIIHTNAAAQEFLSDGKSLRSVHGVLTANDPRNQEGLRRAARMPDLDAKSLSLETEEGRLAVATMLPLTTGLRASYGGQLSASAAIFVHHQPSFDEGLPTTLAAAFGLTGAEARVLSALLEGLNLTETAERFQISVNTVRWHLKRLFEKTGTNRQADLIRLASSTIPPIRVARDDKVQGNLH